MVVELISVLPAWVLLGVALGAIASVLVALAFYLGVRFAPPSVAESGDGWSRSGDARRRREIREYLSAIDERFREDHAFGGVSVPFYLPEREVAITFDAHDYFELEGAGVYAVLCEHEMPGRGLGRRLPFDVVEPDRGPSRPPGDASDRIAAAFAELDVPTDADADEVKRAYRERVKETHPDQGGDEASFRRVQEAYATVRNHDGGGDDSGSARERTGPAPDARRSDRTDRATGFGR
ncbi:DnaJ domain-containing protein [Halorubrum sp. CBA1125]|uniref:J domain-containing protein n=1 Tax=Halorubrum sp. CBA1125 TaxID=2668072 RepID=UPI00135E6392|nr:J domain-containing protein [Halorubrum sp. CBA1125]MUW14413.1 DnaJ domain-containing protein [Halorubrum sp. CBA1125]